MKKIKLTGYARSSIEMELEIFTDRLGYGLKPGSPEYTELAILDGYTDGEYLTIPDNPTIKKALADVLTRLSNGEDGFAEQETNCRVCGLRTAHAGSGRRSRFLVGSASGARLLCGCCRGRAVFASRL